MGHIAGSMVGRVRTQPDPRVHRRRLNRRSRTLPEEGPSFKTISEGGEDHPGLAQNRRHPRRRDRHTLRHRLFHPLPHNTQAYRLTNGNSRSITLESELNLFGALCKKIES
jgi:hypothetical protein